MLGEGKKCKQMVLVNRDKELLVAFLHPRAQLGWDLKQKFQNCCPELQRQQPKNSQRMQYQAFPTSGERQGGGGGASGSGPMPWKTTSSDFPITTTRMHGDRVHQSLKFREKNGSSDSDGGGALYANVQCQESSVNTAASKEVEELTTSAANNSNPCCDSSERSKQQAKRIGREFLSDVRSQMSRRSTEEFAQLLRSLRAETLNAEQGKVI